MWDAEVPARLVLALLLSGLIGFEREAGGKPAGMRTHMLVGLGSALFMLISIDAPNFFPGVKTVDPGRIAAQVVTGVGFLGAGTIIRAGGSIKGLTTAASIWSVSAIGLAVGAGYYAAAAIATALALAVLHFPDMIMGWTRGGVRTVKLDLDCKRDGGGLALIEKTMKERHAKVEFMEVVDRGEHLNVSYQLSVKPDEVQHLVGTLSELEGVTRVTME